MILLVLCLEAYGGFSDECEFWVHHEFSEVIKQLTLKRLKIKIKKENSSEVICINVLEFAIDIILYAAVTLEISNDKPIAIFTELKNDKTFKYINNGHVTELLCEAAKEIY